MQQVGAGGELVPASMLGENSRALEYRSTVDRPDRVAIEASRDRVELADKAGALEMGLDLADTIQADKSRMIHPAPADSLFMAWHQFMKIPPSHVGEHSIALVPASCIGTYGYGGDPRRAEAIPTKNTLQHCTERCFSSLT